MDDVEAKRIAEELVKEHGALAHSVALEQADELFAADDEEASAEWVKVVCAIEEMQEADPSLVWN